MDHYKLDFSSSGASLADAAREMAGLEDTVNRLATALDGVFHGLDTGAAQKSVKSLDSQLLVLRLSLGKLKTALSDAAAPIAAQFLPAIQQGVYGAIRFLRQVGLVTRALFGSAEGSEAAAESQDALSAATGRAARTLASFDKIERLDRGTGSGGKSQTVTTPKLEDTLTAELQRVVDRIRKLMEDIKALFAPLKQMDFSPLAASLSALGQAFVNLGSVIGASLEWAWFNILVPLGKWVIEEAAPAAVNALTGALEVLTAILDPVLRGIQSLLPALRPVAAFMGETFVLTLQTLGQQFSQLGTVFSQQGSGIQAVFRNISDALAGAWAFMRPLLEQLRQLWLALLQELGDRAGRQVEFLISAFRGLTDFLAGVFTGNWSRIWSGLQGLLKGAVNGILGLVNGMISGLVAGINSAISAINGVSVRLPDWLPVYGGQSLGFAIPTVSAPQIPYLAKGAVLPANRPFLAMVGDQRHGTNIEAPLSTIQEAVAGVLGQQNTLLADRVAASTQVQRDILAAVLGISVGDELIGRAADRYARQQAVIRGGAL